VTGGYYRAGRGIQGRYPSATSFVYIEFPKWVDGPDGPEIAKSAEEERCILDRARSHRMQQARSIGRVRANAVQAARANAFAAEIAPMIAAIGAEGITSFRGIADSLNTHGIRSARGRQWGPAQIFRLLRRAENAVATGAAPGRSGLITAR
jgi:hypothetical protein